MIISINVINVKKYFIDISTFFTLLVKEISLFLDGVIHFLICH